MTEQQTTESKVDEEFIPFLDNLQNARVQAAKTASRLVGATGLASHSFTPPAAIIELADWILDLVPGDEDAGEKVEGYPQHAEERTIVKPTTNPDAISHTMWLELTYDGPIMQDTVDALVQSHQDDEGVLRVRGHLAQP